MNGAKMFIPKEDQDLPDSYGVCIKTITETIELNIVWYQIADKVSDLARGPDGSVLEDPHTGDPVFQAIGASGVPFFEYVTKDDEWGLIPLCNVIRIKFDKDYSKMKAIQEKNRQKRIEEIKNADKK